MECANGRHFLMSIYFVCLPMSDDIAAFIVQRKDGDFASAGIEPDAFDVVGTVVNQPFADHVVNRRVEVTNSGVHGVGKAATRSETAVVQKNLDPALAIPHFTSTI